MVKPNMKPVCLVMGAGAGIGGTVARRFAQEGYHACLCRRSDLAGLDRLVDAIRSDGGSATGFLINAIEEGSIEARVAAIEADIGPIEVVVYNLGAQIGDRALKDTTAKAFETGWRMGTFGLFRLAAAVCPLMEARGKGTILVTSSTAAMRGNGGQHSHAAAMGGRRMLCQSLNAEFASKGIHVVHIVIDGAVDAPDTLGKMLGPESVITIRKAQDRGHAQHGWLESFHTFSFAGYQDPAQMGFRALRVINEDRVQPSRGFAKHAHRDMEIVSYVLSGALEHQDSLGNGSVIRPGDVQRMSAGTGVTHSEFNHSASELVHFLQIWILPEREGLPAGYEQKHFAPAERSGKLRLVASPDGRDGSVTVHQDAAIYATLLAGGQSVTHTLPPGRYAWVQVAAGECELGGLPLAAGDGAAISNDAQIRLATARGAEVLLFDLA
jgi:hypothetical protein